MTEMMTPAVLDVDLEALAENYRTILAVAQPARVAAVLKADAYGLGIGPVARRLAREGCAEFFISSLAEGLELRGIVPLARIYVLEGAGGAVAECRAADLIPVLNTPEEVEEWVHEAPESPAALQVDTGMTRVGLHGCVVTLPVWLRASVIQPASGSAPPIAATSCVLVSRFTAGDPN